MKNTCFLQAGDEFVLKASKSGTVSWDTDWEDGQSFPYGDALLRRDDAIRTLTRRVAFLENRLEDKANVEADVLIDRLIERLR